MKNTQSLPIQKQNKALLAKQSVMEKTDFSGIYQDQEVQGHLRISL